MDLLPSLFAADPLHPERWLVWSLITRLGEAQILLPAMAVGLVWLAWPARSPAIAARWLLAMALTATFTTATKIAFIGFEFGYAPLDYTGVSGHSMFAAVVLPVLLAVVTAHARPWLRRGAVGAGVALAVLIAVSRVEVGAHSWAEATIGLLLGLAASAWTLRGGRLPQWSPPVWLPALLLAWLAVMPLHAPPSRTHDWVTKLSLHISGRPQPYTRHQMLHDWRAATSAANSAAALRPLPPA